MSIEFYGNLDRMQASDVEITDRQSLATRIAREAGELTLGFFEEQKYSVDRKSDGSPVTDADRESELLLRKRILAEFPNDAVVGEEFSDTPGSSGFRWILDPIDGTKSFIAGVPLYGTLVGVQHQGSGVIGVIEIPGLNERIYAATNHGAWHQRGDETPAAAKVSPCARLEDGVVLTSDFKGWRERQASSCLSEIGDGSWFMRTWGDCYGYLLVATGRAVAMIDPRVNVWDVAAVQPIIEEAGGIFTDWQGRQSVETGDGLGTNGHVHDQILSNLTVISSLQQSPD